ncbi:type II toxin-antitoxin system RelE/ParE family toxin, partial [Rhizobium favelukesii]|uniref:type II toxin-antitoxin system RelE/ParE family toxin n=1 Tax=Rhizobium favelukesii TaxID=348824 RepID=UPI00215F3A33
MKKLRQALSQFPEMGRQTDEMPAPGVLRFAMGSYLVDYEVGEGRHPQDEARAATPARRAIDQGPLLAPDFGSGRQRYRPDRRYQCAAVILSKTPSFLRELTRPVSAITTTN